MHHGAPQRAQTRHRIHWCHVLVEGNRCIGVHQLSSTLGISYGSKLRMLHKDLNLKKKATKLIPHQLTPDHRQKHRLFCQDFLRRARRIPSFLSSVITTDKAWFYLIETWTKQENMQWLAPTDNRPQEPHCPHNCQKLIVVLFFDQ